MGTGGGKEIESPLRCDSHSGLFIWATARDLRNLSPRDYMLVMEERNTTLFAGQRWSKGRLFKVPRQVQVEAVALAHARFPSKTWDMICRQVAKEYGLTRQAIRFNTEAIRWAN